MFWLCFFKGAALNLRSTNGHIIALLITPDWYKKFPILYIHLCWKLTMFGRLIEDYTSIIIIIYIFG